MIKEWLKDKSLFGMVRDDWYPNGVYKESWVLYSDVEGWSQDEHAQALALWLRSSFDWDITVVDQRIIA